MKIISEIQVSLKSGHLDPEGLTIKKSLSSLNYNIEEVKTSKIYKIKISASSIDEAKTITDEICKRLLVNPTKDEYKIQVEKV